MQRRTFLAAGMTALVARPASAATAPQRIVCVGGAITEIVFALGAGAHVIAVDTTSLYPGRAVAPLPKVGYLRQLSVEGLLSTRPDLILADVDAGPKNVLDQLQSMGAPLAHFHAEHSVAALHALRELGVRLALDDFGTGYSSLSYLHSLPLDILKIAKPFVDRVAEASQDSFVRMMIDLAKALELEVIAEGIETAEQVEALRVLQSRFGQGFFLARPAAAKFLKLARSRAILKTSFPSAAFMG